MRYDVNAGRWIAWRGQPDAMRAPEPAVYALVVYRDRWDIGCVTIADAEQAAAEGRVLLIAREPDPPFNPPRVIIEGE